jgi:hypothetical protein
MITSTGGQPSSRIRSHLSYHSLPRYIRSHRGASPVRRHRTFRLLVDSPTQASHPSPCPFDVVVNDVTLRSIHWSRAHLNFDFNVFDKKKNADRLSISRSSSGTGLSTPRSARSTDLTYCKYCVAPPDGARSRPPD